MNSKLMIAVAGAGKTTFLINEALQKKGKVLITTYTNSNEEEIKNKLYNKLGCIPANIEVQTWFEFLLRQGVRPFQGIMDDSLFEKNIGFFLTQNKSAMYTKESNTLKFYFTEKYQIYHDKISKFVIKCNEKSGGMVLERIAKIYAHIFIDEIQDMVGNDLDILELLINSSSELLMVGDPRQTTYSTHPTNRYMKYQNGKIEKFVKEVINVEQIKCNIDPYTLNVSHRNNDKICSFSSKLYPYLPEPHACKCDLCRDYDSEHIGIFFLRKGDIPYYLAKYNAVQLRWSKSVKCNPNYLVHNFGESKGLSFDRVIIYATADMISWIQDNSTELADQTRAKFYVAITRARKSVAIVVNNNMTEEDMGDDFCFYVPTMEFKS